MQEIALALTIYVVTPRIQFFSGGKSLTRLWEKKKKNFSQKILTSFQPWVEVPRATVRVAGPKHTSSVERRQVQNMAKLKFPVSDSDCDTLPVR